MNFYTAAAVPAVKTLLVFIGLFNTLQARVLEYTRQMWICCVVCLAVFKLASVYPKRFYLISCFVDKLVYFLFHLKKAVLLLGESDKEVSPSRKYEVFIYVLILFSKLKFKIVCTGINLVTTCKFF